MAISDFTEGSSNIDRLQELSKRLSDVEYDLAYSNALLASIVNNAAEAILSKDKDGLIIQWNNAAQKLYGYSRDEAVGRHVNILIPDDKKDEFAGVLRSVMEGHPVINLPTERLRKDGSRIKVVLVVVIL
jgi:PAS domain S-box-containing protein